MIGGKLADEQGGQIATLADVFENLDEAAQVRRVFRQSATAKNSQHDRIGGALLEAMLIHKLTECARKRFAADQRVGGHNASRQRPDTRNAEAADKILRQDGEPFLQGIVPGEPNFQQPQWLCRAIVVSDEMCADLVLQKCLRTACGDTRFAADQ